MGAMECRTDHLFSHRESSKAQYGARDTTGGLTIFTLSHGGVLNGE